MRKLLKSCIEVYRPLQLDRLHVRNGELWPEYSMGPLRARVRLVCIPLPTLWACDIAFGARQ